MEKKLGFSINRALPLSRSFKERFIIHCSYINCEIFNSSCHYCYRPSATRLWFFFLWVSVSKWDFSSCSHVVQEISGSSCQDCYHSSAARVVSSCLNWPWSYQPLNRKSGGEKSPNMDQSAFLGFPFVPCWLFPLLLLLKVKKPLPTCYNSQQVRDYKTHVMLAWKK